MTALFVMLFAADVWAANKKPAFVPPQAAPVETAKLQNCLKRADELPDMAAAEAAAWIRQGGGNDAHLCRAFAQTHRGMHEDAAREFWALASYYKKSDAKRSVSLHDLAGQEFLRAQDVKNADAQYAASLKLAPGDADAYVGRAATRMATEKYWDALDNLNHALKIDPANVDALRQRGRAWAQLGNDKNASEDFERAADLTAATPAAKEN